MATFEPAILVVDHKACLVFRTIHCSPVSRDLHLLLWSNIDVCSIFEDLNTNVRWYHEKYLFDYQQPEISVIE